MKILITSFLIFITVIVTSYSNEVAGIRAIVNNEIITTKDVKDYCLVIDNRVVGEDGSSFCDTENGLDEVLNMLIEDKLILTRAKKEDIQISEDWVNSRLKQIAKGYGTEEEFVEIMMAKGLTMGMLRKRIENQYLSKYIVEKKIKAGIIISPSDVSKYYTEHISEFSEPETYQFLLASSRDKAEMETLARRIKSLGKDVAMAENDENLIAIESPLNDMRADIVDIIKKLRTDEYTVSVVDGKYQLLYLTAIIPVRTRPFKEVQPLVYGKLWEKEFKKRFREWMDNVKNESVIKIFPRS